MRLFDREVHGGLDKMFDFNHDGVLNMSEQMAELMYLDDTVSADADDEDDEDEL